MLATFVFICERFLNLLNSSLCSGQLMLIISELQNCCKLLATLLRHTSSIY